MSKEVITPKKRFKANWKLQPKHSINGTQYTCADEWLKAVVETRTAIMREYAKANTKELL